MCFRGRRWDVCSVSRGGQRSRQIVFINEDLVSGVELSGEVFVGGDLLQKLDRPEIEIDLQSGLVLNDVSRSLLSVVVNKRIAIDGQHRAKHIQPASIDVK